MTFEILQEFCCCLFLCSSLKVLYKAICSKNSNHNFDQNSWNYCTPLHCFRKCCTCTFENQCCLETLRKSNFWVANIVQLLESSIVKMLHAHQNYCVAVRSSGLVRFTSITHFFILWRTQSVCLPGQARPKLDQQPT